ncbi:MAG: protein kinase domain-containing protein [Planctomycetota bacterium]
MEGYEILEKVAEAGQGQVWRAVQLSTGREVAIKIPRVGSVTSERARLRFEREIELVARLKHPNIARIYESGIDQGQYYYVMDFISGTNLDDYVAKKGLSQRQIIEIMRSICLAVQHAHQMGVIHRDLKPSNILVTEEGHPFVVDFGLAKGLLETEADKNVSLEGETVGTPAYMSPEQAAGDTDGIDTRSDVYSLGVILFNLLIGESPHDLTGPRQQVLHRIADGQIKRPRTVCRRIDKEVEWLLLKALECEPDRRYLSGQQFAEDIECYLKGVPLLASPPGISYRLVKFIKRNKISVAVTTMAAVVIITACVLSITMYIKAKLQTQRAQDINNFLNDSVLSALNPNRSRGGEVTPLSILDSVVSALEGRFTDTPLIEASIRHRLGMNLARFGDYEAAILQKKRALEIRQKQLGDNHLLTVNSMFELGVSYWEQGRLNEAEPLVLETISKRTRQLGPENSETLYTMIMLAANHAEMGELRKAMQICHQVLTTARRVGGDEHQRAIQAMHMIGYLNTELGDYTEAEKWYRRAVQLAEQVLGEDHSWTASFTSYLGRICMLQGNYPEAESILQRGYAKTRDVFGDQWNTCDILADLIRLYVGWGRSVKAHDLREELQTFRKQWIFKRNREESNSDESVSLTGNIRFDERSNTYTVRGTGIDIWHVFDEFHFAHKMLDGDGEIKARVEDLQRVACWTKAGIMMRNSIEPTSKHASVFIRPGGVVEFQSRAKERGPTRSIRLCVRDMTFPHWIKLKRQGNIFTGYHSSDGLNWKEIRGDDPNQPAHMEVTMGRAVNIGLAVTSSDAGRTAEAQFSNVNITGDVSPKGPFTVSEDIGFQAITLPKN